MDWPSGSMWRQFFLMLSSRKAWSLPTWAGSTWISLQLTSCRGRQSVGYGSGTIYPGPLNVLLTHTHTHTAHQFHQLFGLADVLWDGHQFVVAHQQNFEGEAEQVFWQNWQEVSAEERERWKHWPIFQSVYRSCVCSLEIGFGPKRKCYSFIKACLALLNAKWGEQALDWPLLSAYNKTWKTNYA